MTSSSSIQDLATYAVRNSKLLTKHLLPFDSLSNLYESLTEQQNAEHQDQLASLYLAMFKPARVGKVLTPMQTLSKFAAKGDVRYYLNYVFIGEDGIGMASTGHIAILTKHSTGLDAGFYDPKALLKVEEPSFAKFPTFDKVLQGVKPLDDVSLDQPNEINFITPGKGKPSECRRFGAFWYYSEYIKTAMNSVKDYQLSVGSTGALIVENEDYKVVVMPTRL